jgi:tetratricopeptide (TPR) repeat protein
MTQLNAFVARSFDPQDEERIRPVLEFLETFRDAGFFCESADRAEVESVSKKVRGMIDERQVFIGFFTRRYPVYNFSSRIHALRLLFGNVSPQIWSAPAWVLQESGYALRSNKELILLREPSVEVFGLQGDLEYITFDPANPAAVQHKLSEMIHKLLAKAAGTEVRVVVSKRAEEAEVAKEPAPPESSGTPSGGDEKQLTIVEHLIRMQTAGSERDFGVMREAWDAGTALIAQGEKWIDQLGWDCFYNEFQYEAGAPEGLEALRTLMRDNPGRAEPKLAAARCLEESNEFEESAKLFLEASSLQDEQYKGHSLISAAKAFRKIKKYAEASHAVELVMPIATDELREEAIRLRYLLLKDSGRHYLAFAAAEFALHENPQLRLRFTLGLDYHRKDLTSMALFHFKFLHGHNHNDSSSLHNLALMYADSKLPIRSVRLYKKAFSMGETLSAANLGFMYLDCGMADEAKEIIEQAIKVEKHEGRVEKCLADIIRRADEEEEKEAALLDAAASDRDLLLRIGQALLRPLPSVNGLWKLPFGEMEFMIGPGRLSGAAEIRTELPRYQNALVGTAAAGEFKTDRYTLEGTVDGAVCEFNLTVEDVSEPSSFARLSSLLGGSKNKSGFIIFDYGGESADYTELSKGKLGKTETLTRLR